MWAAFEKQQAGEFGVRDMQQTYDDSVIMALRDQEGAGVDLITDGEMRRFGFVTSFYSLFPELEMLPPPRRAYAISYESEPVYRARAKLSAPNGLGIRQEYAFARRHTAAPMKVTCPGPMVLGSLIRPKPAYRELTEVLWDLAAIINIELRGLAADGAEFIQVDDVFMSHWMDPSLMVDLYNRCVEGIDGPHLTFHVCFGTLGRFSFSERLYRPLMPHFRSARADQLALEFGDRMLAEIDLWRQFDMQVELGFGCVSPKNFYIEKPAEVAESIRQALAYVPADKLFVTADCGFARTPRWLSFRKLCAMVEGARLVRRELTGEAAKS